MTVQAIPEDLSREAILLIHELFTLPPVSLHCNFPMRLFSAIIFH